MNVSEAEKLIKELKYEIRKRDSIISNLREANDKLRRGAMKLIAVMADTPNEYVDHEIANKPAEKIK